MWLRREREKVSRIKEIFRFQLGEYKRRLSNSRPYHKIMDEREIRRLKTQVLSSRIRILNGRPHRKHTQSRSYSAPPHDYFATLALKDFENFATRRTSLDRDSIYVDGQDSVDSRLLAINTHRGMDDRFKQQVNSRDISTSNILQLSLQTLASQSNRKRQSKGKRKPAVSAQQTIQPENVEEAFPSENFLSGSLWCGRNLVVSMDRLHSDIVTLKADVITDVELTTNNLSEGHHLEDELLEIIRRGLQDIVNMTNGCTKRVKRHLQV